MKTSGDPESLPPQLRRAPPVGRVLRILFGLALIAWVAPVYFRVPARVAAGSLLLLLGLIAVYVLIHIALTRRIAPFGRWAGVVVAMGLLVAVYAAGASGLPVLGHGKGQLAAVTFLGVSLILAGARAVPGCELMAIPDAFLGNQAELPCLMFSPLDRLERKLRRKTDA
jgi:hypothetical protein